MCKPLKFRGIKEFTWTRIAKEISSLSGQNIEYMNPEGTVEFQDGIHIKWTYDSSSCDLRIVCTHRPDEVDCKKIYSRLEEIVKSKIVTL